MGECTGRRRPVGLRSCPVSTCESAVGGSAPVRGSLRLAALDSPPALVPATVDDRLPGRPEALEAGKLVQLLGGRLVEGVAPPKLGNVPCVDPAAEERSEESPDREGNGGDNEEWYRDHASEDADPSSATSIRRSPYVNE